MWLANAHVQLDATVFAAYKWPEDIPDEEILRNLLTLNQERMRFESIIKEVSANVTSE